MKKILVVYYSRSGVSKKAAERLYELLVAELGDDSVDVEEIIDLKSRSGFLGALASMRDALSDNITKIEAVKNNPSGYLEVIAVTPIWCGKVSDALRTYFAAYKSDIRSLKLVLCGGTDSVKQGDQVLRYVFRSFALKTKAFVTLRKKTVLNGDYDSALKTVTSYDEIESNYEKGAASRSTNAADSPIDKGDENER